MTLAWAGDPVAIPQNVGASPSRPRVISMGSAVAIVFEVESGNQHLLASGTVTPWNAWPPSFGAFDANFPVEQGGGAFAVSEGEPGNFAFTLRQPRFMGILGQAMPGENGASFVNYIGDGEDVWFLSRSSTGTYGIGFGPPGELFAYLLPGLAPDQHPTPAGPLTCSREPVPAAIAPLGASFLVASANEAPFATCFGEGSPLPAQVVQTIRLEALGGWTPLDVITADAAVDEIVMTPHDAGAWVGFRTRGDDANVLVVSDHDEKGFTGGEVHILGPAPEEDALVGVDRGFAHVHATRGDTSPTGAVGLELWLDHGATSVAASPLSAVAPSAPAMARNLAGTSFLVTYVDASRGAPRVMLARADCSDGF